MTERRKCSECKEGLSFTEGDPCDKCGDMKDESLVPNTKHSSGQVAESPHSAQKRRSRRTARPRERTWREWRDWCCAIDAHQMAPVVIKGKAAVFCLECDGYLRNRNAVGYTLRVIAAKHFSRN